MRNLILFAVDYGVTLSEADVDGLGYEPTEEQFKDYFSIPAETAQNSFTHAFDVADLYGWMNEDEIAALASHAPADETADTPVTDLNAKADDSATVAEIVIPKKGDIDPETGKAYTAAKIKDITAAKKAADKKAAEDKKAADKKAAEDAKAKEKADKEAAKNAEKKPGVIQTILLAIAESDKPVTQEDIVSRLKADFPDKTPDSMLNTVKAQIGSKTRPLRMEQEKGVTFTIVDEVKAVEAVAAKAAEGDKPAVEAVAGIAGSPRTYFLEDSKYRDAKAASTKAAAPASAE